MRINVLVISNYRFCICSKSSPPKPVIYYDFCIKCLPLSLKKKIEKKTERDTHYEYFRCMECFWFFVNILWRHVLVSRRKMRWKFLLSVYYISKTQRQPFFSAKFMWHFCPVWIPHDVSLYRMKNI